MLQFLFVFNQCQLLCFLGLDGMGVTVCERGIRAGSCVAAGGKGIPPPKFRFIGQPQSKLVVCQFDASDYVAVLLGFFIWHSGRRFFPLVVVCSTWTRGARRHRRRLPTMAPSTTHRRSWSIIRATASAVGGKDETLRGCGEMGGAQGQIARCITVFGTGTRTRGKSQQWHFPHVPPPPPPPSRSPPPTRSGCICNF